MRCVRVCVGVAGVRVIQVVHVGCVHGSRLYEPPARKHKLTVCRALQVCLADVVFAATSNRIQSAASSQTPQEIHIRKCRRGTGRTHVSTIAKCVETSGFESNCKVFWDETVLSNANQIAGMAIASTVLHGDGVCDAATTIPGSL